MQIGPRGGCWFALPIMFCQPPLIWGVGFHARRAPNIRVRDEPAIAATWQKHEATLVHLWITGWLPGSDAKFTGMKSPGLPGTRPPGWWKHAPPEPRRSDESEYRYIARLDLWVEGEKEAFAARERRAKIIGKMTTAMEEALARRSAQ